MNSDFDILPFNWPNTQKTTTHSLLFQQKPLAFQQKPFENMYFPGKFKKPQKNPSLFKTPENTLGLRE